MFIFKAIVMLVCLAAVAGMLVRIWFDVLAVAADAQQSAWRTLVPVLVNVAYILFALPWIMAWDFVAPRRGQGQA